MTTNYPTPQTFEDLLSTNRRDMDRSSRRVAAVEATDLLGPGMSARAMEIVDWNSEEATYNGFFYANVGSISSPDPLIPWIGSVIAQDDGAGMQSLWDTESEAAEESPRLFQRRWTPHPDTGEPMFQAWEQFSAPTAYIEDAHDTAHSALETAQEALEEAEAGMGFAVAAVWSFRQPTAPTDADAPDRGLKNGDIWFDSDDNNRIYRRQGGAWVDARDLGIQEAIDAAADAFAAASAAADDAADAMDFAETRNQMFKQPTAPTVLADGPLFVNDVWFDDDDGNRPRWWDGDSWEGTPFGTGAIADGAVTGPKIPDAALATPKFVSELRASLGQIFIDDFSDVSRWTNAGAGMNFVAASPADAEFGSSVGRATDYVYRVHETRVPFDPNQLYRVTFRARRPAGGTRTAYFGIRTYGADGTTPVGANSGNLYVAASAVQVTAGFTEYVGYIKGTAVANGSAPATNMLAPTQVIDTTRFISSLFLANYNTASSEVTEISMAKIEAVPTGQVATANIFDLAVTNAKISEVSAEKLQANTAFINALTVKTTLTLGDASNNGIIESYNFASTTPAVRIEKTGLTAKGGTITAATVQSESTAARGIKLTSTALTLYNASGVATLTLTASSGAITATGPIFTAADISGSTVTGGTLQSEATAARGIKMNSSGLTLYNGSGVATLTLTASTGAIVATGAVMSGGSVTGSTVQTETTASRGIKLTSTTLTAYDGSGNVKVLLTASTGALVLTGPVVSAGDISGSTVTGGTVQSEVTAARGIKLNSTGFTAYDGSGNPTFTITAATGAVVMLGSLLSGSTITGATITAGTIRTAATGVRMEISDFGSGGFFRFFPETTTTTSQAGGLTMGNFLDAELPFGTDPQYAVILSSGSPNTVAPGEAVASQIRMYGRNAEGDSSAIRLYADQTYVKGGIETEGGMRFTGLSPTYLEMNSHAIRSVSELEMDPGAAIQGGPQIQGGPSVTGGLNVTGGATVSGGLTVSSSGANITGPLSVTGQIDFDNLGGSGSRAVMAGAGGVLSAPSSMEVKENPRPIPQDMVDEFYGLDTFLFEWKGGHKDLYDEGTHAGLSAQEFAAKGLEHWVVREKNGDIFGLRDWEIIPVLLKMLQQQNERLIALEVQ